MRTLLGLMLLLTALFLILIVLVQRGRGGGLTGALGGPGGQSAFGSKAGDLFTKITVWTAGLWIVLCIVSIKVMAGGSSELSDGKENKPAATKDKDSGTGAGDNSETTESGETDTPDETETPAKDGEE
jgi:preprotein translocase subunit SecG